LGQKFSTFNESGWDGSNCKKCVKVYQYNFYCISALFTSFFVRSGFVGSRTRGLHGLDWVCLILGWVELNQLLDLLHVPCRRVPTYTASMTISKTERSGVRNIYGNAVTQRSHLHDTHLWECRSRARIFTGTAFPCVPTPLHPRVPIANS